jgi:hypothetical protein
MARAQASMELGFGSMICKGSFFGVGCWFMVILRHANCGL